MFLFIITSVWITTTCQEKMGKRVSLSETTGTYDDWLQWNKRHSSEHIPAAEDVYRNQLRRSLDERDGIFFNASFYDHLVKEREEYLEKLNSGLFFNDQRRLVEDLLDPEFYEKTVHPKRNHLLPTRINVSMSLYQILDIDEHKQSIVVNVWMVQNWFDEFLDWDPHDYGLINKTIVPHDQLWIPDTYLYNSETLEQKQTESIMNAIVETGYWANDSSGARVQLMFPAIYKLSCHMNVQWFPYDSQNCSFIISSWTRDKATIDYWPMRPGVNLQNMARNDEWEVVSFDFHRIEQNYKCCKDPWVMLYAHMVIRRKPLYYIINLVIPTSIITIVAVTGFFTPTSSSSERDEKLYLGINTLLTMSIMMLMVCNQMPSTSTYVPLMSWYYIGVILVIVVGTLMATIVLAIHNQKHVNKPIPTWVRRLIHNRYVNSIILDVPSALLELWEEFGIETGQRTSMMDPFLLESLDPVSQLPPRPRAFFGSFCSESSDTNSFDYTVRLANITKQYTTQVRNKDKENRSLHLSNSSQARNVKRQKMHRRCSMEWEFLASVLDRILLTLFTGITCILFLCLVFFDYFTQLYQRFTNTVTA
ncbi:unnamed protein product [Auanema sp. JU1783]|nr:unnamed protein product [Auanema sp. JU1783]